MNSTLNTTQTANSLRPNLALHDPMHVSNNVQNEQTPSHVMGKVTNRSETQRVPQRNIMRMQVTVEMFITERTTTTTVPHLPHPVELTQTPPPPLTYTVMRVRLFSDLWASLAISQTTHVTFYMRRGNSYNNNSNGSSSHHPSLLRLTWLMIKMTVTLDLFVEHHTMAVKARGINVYP